LAFGKGSHSTEHWLKQLNGNITFIKGGHDRTKNAIEHYPLNYKNHEFLLLHNPNQKPIDWKGWIIHGHKHNNDLDNYPFINGKTKTINVSAELINYRPLNLNSLLALNLDATKRMDTINSKAE
jgi:calcineurin-like phosphoesterase family protein